MSIRVLLTLVEFDLGFHSAVGTTPETQEKGLDASLGEQIVHRPDVLYSLLYVGM